MVETRHQTSVAVIGAGPGGYAAAFMAADLGLDVALIDMEENPGGVCLYRGCIPSKALLHAAQVIQESRKAPEMGITFQEPRINLDTLRDWKAGIVQRLTRGLGQLSRQRKITYIRGKARFLDSRSLSITREEGEETWTFEKAILATGTRVAGIPGLSLESPRLWDSSRALDLPSVPGTLLVIGGGYIGLELGTVYAALGSRVTVVEMMPNILPGVDADLVAVYKRHAKKRFDSIQVNTKALDMKETDQGLSVTLQDNAGKTQTETFEAVLMAIGRKSDTTGLGLENTQVKTGPGGFVTIDEKMQTGDPSILAIGDITGGALLAHKATHQGRIAAEVLAGKKASWEVRAMPAVVYTDPEIATCGLTETEARNMEKSVQVVKFPWGAAGRALTMGWNDGVTKLIIDPETERVLGMGIVGPGAGELIAEGALAVEMAALASDLAETVHPHPTLSETVMEAAESFYGTCTHIYRPLKK
jgi:dihydrolipoamide dehydrogenase